MQRLFLTALLMRDYDEAITFYVNKLGFEVRLDTVLSETKRWVVLAPCGGGQGCILLAKAETKDQDDYIGNQTGGRVFLFLDTDDFQRDYDTYTARGVTFAEPPGRGIWHCCGIGRLIRQPLGLDPTHWEIWALIFQNYFK